MDLVAFWTARIDEDEAAAKAAHGWTAAYSSEDGNFADRFDPARVLREVESKRQIIRCYQEAQRSLVPEGEDALCEVIGVLVSVYSDHPDYHEVRKPFLT